MDLRMVMGELYGLGSEAAFDVFEDAGQVVALGLVVDLLAVDPDGEHASVAGLEPDSVETAAELLEDGSLSVDCPVEVTAGHAVLDLNAGTHPVSAPGVGGDGARLRRTTIAITAMRPIVPRIARSYRPNQTLNAAATPVVAPTMVMIRGKQQIRQAMPTGEALSFPFMRRLRRPR
jgi:hypothetical protein